jgi:hypothetical protein
MAPLGFALDANVFIEAARRYYAFDLAPLFWDSLINQAANGRIRSIDRVKQELERGKDSLADWINKKFSDNFASTDDEDIVKCYGEIMKWVKNQDQFSDAAKYDFAGVADGWLVAYAKVKGYWVVTHEIMNIEIKKKVPIPNICKAFNVPFVDTFEMLRSLGVRFA